MEMKNIFQIWQENGERLPFKARRATWAKEHYVIVDDIKIKSWPYGIAYGKAYTWGEINEWHLYDKDWKTTGAIPNAGAYKWLPVFGSELPSNPKEIHKCLDDGFLSHEYLKGFSKGSLKAFNEALMVIRNKQVSFLRQGKETYNREIVLLNEIYNTLFFVMKTEA
jgi:hypothetical protein